MKNAPELTASHLGLAVDVVSVDFDNTLCAVPGVLVSLLGLERGTGWSLTKSCPSEARAALWIDLRIAPLPPRQTQQRCPKSTGPVLARAIFRCQQRVSAVP
jgi:hypothetical protein